jgi:predicted enzyme related to lactoylglutathione lyase
MLQKVAFTLLPVRDAARARHFYEDVLGLTRGSAAAEGTWTEYDLPEGGCLALYQTEDLQPSASAGATIAFEVDDLDATIASLKQRGVEFKLEMVHSPVCRMSIALDSEGNGLILHELKRER